MGEKKDTQEEENHDNPRILDALLRRGNRLIQTQQQADPCFIALRRVQPIHFNLPPYCVLPSFSGMGLAGIEKDAE